MCGEVGRCTNTRPILVVISMGGRGDVVYSRSGCGGGGFIDPQHVLFDHFSGDSGMVMVRICEVLF